ncbi:hypothetical protein [Nonomuraea pusilla]|uniref:Uncharacterized protein n=1 Tax=Nonomuraea pusilla TaxID=46177 RepID=A0A1H8CX32_9ACTN|nr:hypothetical protein [Nonomuraea pusilla]SEM99575.1 hypothetical protein SAMN05660976_06573 [Nonomuraea pusilla]
MRLTRGRPAGLPTPPPLPLALALAGTLASAACAASAPPAATPSSRIGSVSDLVLPFDSYKPNPAQRALLGRAHGMLVGRCMAENGLDVSPPTEDATAATADPGNARRYGVVDTAAARRHGYHLDRPSSRGSSAAWAAALPKPARLRLYGTAADRGCLDRASLALDRGSRKADWAWLALQDSLTLDQAAKRPAVAAAEERWRSCMTQEGYAYPDPEAAIADRRWNLDGQKVTEEEKRTATADAMCKWASGLVSAWYTADAELQRAVVRDNPERFARLRDNLLDRLGRAAQVLGGRRG